MTIPPLILNNRLLKRYGSRRMSVLASGASAVIAAGGVVPTLLADGLPNFWLWYGWLVIVAGFITLATPVVYALALEPMGELAGTASSLMYFTGFALGAGLAAIFDALIDATATPFVVGFALYTGVGFCFLLWAGGPQPKVGQT